MNILFLYNSTQTFTNTVYEHISSFVKYSANSIYFCHQDQTTELNVDLSRFDAVGIHYSIRLPYDQLSPSTVKALEGFQGLKFLFIQDEYDFTHRAWYWIKNLGLQLVFTVVPEAGIRQIYPSYEFPYTRFVSNLTGYVPDTLSWNSEAKTPSQRSLIVGYRGRPLPVKYGQLGQEKVEIGKLTKRYCEVNSLSHDIEWSEEKRIYGPEWYDFMASCRGMLGSESGSNVFDWDGTLSAQIASFRKENRYATDIDIYNALIQTIEMPGIMNQVSPRVFEAIALRTVLVLFEGTYSGILEPYTHFIPLKKDGSNLEDVFSMLNNGEYADQMAERAYQDIIASGKYSYQSFVQMVDQEIKKSVDSICQKNNLAAKALVANQIEPSPITTFPIRAIYPRNYGWKGQIARRVWRKLPTNLRKFLGPYSQRFIKKI